MIMSNTYSISEFIEKYFLHFNAATLVDAAKAYENQINNGSKMLVSLAGAMSTAELGKIFSEVPLIIFNFLGYIFIFCELNIFESS